MANEIDTLLGVRQMQSYGCVRCQHEHYSDEAIFETHIGFQSKHGVRNVPSTTVADERQYRVGPVAPSEERGQ